MALGLVAALTGCGSSAADEDRAATAVPALPLHNFDIYVTGSDVGNELQADIYGITLSPFAVDRITVDKRISWLSASTDSVVVAAGDEQIDKLASVEQGGNLVPLGRLGRPAAYGPEIQADGTIRFVDDGPGEAFFYRYISYDPDSEKTKVLYQSKKLLSGVSSSRFGFFTHMVRPNEGVDSVALVSRDGSRRTFPIAPRIATAESGARFIAVGVYGSDSSPTPTETVLIDPTSGKKSTIAGWAPLGWNPDRTKLLVVRSADAGLPDAELAVLNPARPAQPEPLGTIPNLTLFSSAWVERA